MKLPMGDGQQILAEYADDASLTLLGKEEPTKEVINTLVFFTASSRLILNRISCMVN